MSRQHCPPILLPSGGGAPVVLPRHDGILEDRIQALIQSHPGILPIAEIDPAYLGAIPVCREMATPAGPIDNFLVTPRGQPVLVECKLWRNPQARREVVGQVLDYAKELARWTSSDIDREVRRRRGRPLVELLREVVSDLDEADFHDQLTQNLARGRSLLLIVGDGIREGVEAIFEHLREQSALHFSLGLVEMPIHRLPDGSLLVAPRILARAAVEVRQVVELPVGMALTDVTAAPIEPPSLVPDEKQEFWREFFTVLRLDDTEQTVPKPPRQGYTALFLPAPGGSCWLNVYRMKDAGRVGLFLSWNGNSIGERAARSVIAQWSDEMRAALGGEASLELHSRRDGDTQTIFAARTFGDLDDAKTRKAALIWLADQTNRFVNYFRPAIRAAVKDIEETES